jgi:thiol-disulfide isomerase/thioredoxin
MAPLTVDNVSKIPSLEKALKSGRINIILVFAEWCGACHKFRKNIWNPMLKRNALHNRIAVRDDMVGKTSLANTKFDYLPSILVVDEKGVTQTFETPEGKVTNAMPTPKSLEDMTRVVNVPVKPNSLIQEDLIQEPMNIAVRKNTPPSNTIAPSNKSLTPPGVVYSPSTLTSPPEQKGGALLASLEAASRGILPAAILGGLSLALKGGKRKTSSRRKVDRRTRKHKKSAK